MYVIARKAPLALYLRWQMRSVFAAVRENARVLFAADDNASPVCEDVNVTAARLLDTYGNSILRLAYSYLHNRSDAEEVVQDTLIR